MGKVAGSRDLKTYCCQGKEFYHLDDYDPPFAISCKGCGRTFFAENGVNHRVKSRLEVGYEKAKLLEAGT